MGTPFKLRSGNTSSFKNLGSSPMKQMPPGFNIEGSKKAGEKILTKQQKDAKYKKAFDKFQSQKQKGKQFAKNILKKGKDVAKKTIKIASKRVPIVTALSMLMGKSAEATQPGTGTHGGTKQKTYNPETGKYE